MDTNIAIINEELAIKKEDLNGYYAYYTIIIVTGFEKTRLPHTYNFMNLANHNSLHQS